MTSSFRTPFIAASPFGGFGLKIYFLELVLRTRLRSTACLKWERGPSRTNLFFLVQMQNITEAARSHGDPSPRAWRARNSIQNFLYIFYCVLKKPFCSVLRSQHTPFFCHSFTAAFFLPSSTCLHGDKGASGTPCFLEGTAPKARKGFVSHGLILPSKENSIATEHNRYNSVPICNSSIGQQLGSENDSIRLKR